MLANYVISVCLTDKSAGPFMMTTWGNQYTLTVICMLTNYVICVPLIDKFADIAVSAYLREVYCRLGGIGKIVSTRQWQ